jgi:hypothetical protein
MNPCPAVLEIHPDLAGYRVFPNRRSLKPELPSGLSI